MAGESNGAGEHLQPSGERDAAWADGGPAGRCAPGRIDDRAERLDPSWHAADVWFDESWSLRSLKRRMSRLGAAALWMCVGAIAVSAWRASPPSDRANAQSAGIVDLTDSSILEITGFLKRSYSPLPESTSLTDRVAFATATHSLKDLEEWLGRRPECVPLSEPMVDLLGVSKSAMPGGERLAHVRYQVHRAESPNVVRNVSLFVLAADGSVDVFREGTTYGVMGGDTSIRIWKRDGLVYYLLGESRWANNVVLQAMKVDPVSNTVRISPRDLELLGDKVGDGTTN